MWTHRHLNKNPYVNKIGYNLNKYPYIVPYKIYDFEDYHRVVLRGTQCDWYARRVRKVYTLKIGKTAEMFRKISCSKSKGIYNYKKLLRHKYKWSSILLSTSILNKQKVELGFTIDYKIAESEMHLITSEYIEDLLSELADNINNDLSEFEDQESDEVYLI